ncbi:MULTISPECIES: hypothetical protein [Duganella]
MGRCADCSHLYYPPSLHSHD